MENNLNYELYVGNDNGNSEHDMIINGDFFSQPNIYSKVVKLPNLDEVSIPNTIENLSQELIVSIESPSVPKGIYYVGEKAFLSGAPISNIDIGIASNKFESNIPIVNTLALIAKYVTVKAYNENPNFEGTIYADVNMCTALPVSQFSKETADFFADRFTKGEHKVTVHVGTLKSNVIIKFDFVKVIAEGVTATFALSSLAKEKSDIFDEFCKTYKCKVDDKYFKNKDTKILHIAIGEGTTEYPLTKGRIYDPGFAKGSDNGVGQAIDACLPDFISSKSLRNSFSRQNFSEALKNDNNKYHNDALEFINPYLEYEAEAIFKYAKNRISLANNDIDLVVCYGGGSIAMQEYLQPQLKSFCNKTDIKLLYVPTKYAISLEAIGLYEFTQMPSFAKLKARNSEEI